MVLTIIACSNKSAAAPSRNLQEAEGLFTGHPPICPRWAFEPWVWEDNKNIQEAALNLVKGYRDRGIPVGTIIIDSPWETAYNSFDWDKERYPEPQKMINELHHYGIRVVMWITGAMNRTSKDTPQDKPAAYDDVIRKRWAVNEGREFHWWKGKGVHIDFTNKKACDWFGTQMAKLMKMGIDGWKVDEAEQYLADPLQATSIGAINKAEFKPYYYAAVADLSKKLNPESLILARPFSASINKSTATWGGDYSGDWEGLRSQMHRLYTAAQAGYSAICVEVGGFLGAKPTKESLIRYAQFGALMPVMNNGGSNGGLSNHLPWFHDEETVDIYRYYAVLHSELVPYLFSCSVDAHLRGGSIVKSPDTDKAQHLLGEQLFASPLVSSQNEKHVVLPETGHWVDYWNEEELLAPESEMDLQVPISRTPLFLRAGAIVPMHVCSDVTGHGDHTSAEKETILVYPHKRSSYLYHRPRGAGIHYDDIKLSMDEQSGTLTVDGAKSISYRFRIKSFGKPERIKGAGSWSYDQASQCISIDKEGARFSVQLEGLKAYSAISVEPPLRNDGCATNSRAVDRGM
jgi:alpha-glucosidase (family GH31 glycosyl hydrolase)